jgi:hypothetical protein
MNLSGVPLIMKKKSVTPYHKREWTALLFLKNFRSYHKKLKLRNYVQK